jgi:hypothetical protein
MGAKKSEVIYLRLKREFFALGINLICADLQATSFAKANQYHLRWPQAFALIATNSYSRHGISAGWILCRLPPRHSVSSTAATTPGCSACCAGA